MRSYLVVCAAAALVACGDNSTDAEPEPLTNDDFAPALNVDLAAMTETPSGLYYQDLEVGTGDEALGGMTVSVHYEGWLADGTKFDSSRDRGTPFEFPLGAGSVIAGWDEGVRGMRVGGMRKLVIPPDLGYGSSGAGGGVIPGNATLVFDVELLEVK
jgi:FKBP-type peptidyl-prolyl cis-trans isomerase